MHHCTSTVHRCISRWFQIQWICASCGTDSAPSSKTLLVLWFWDRGQGQGRDRGRTESRLFLVVPVIVKVGCPFSKERPVFTLSQNRKRELGQGLKFHDSVGKCPLKVLCLVRCPVHCVSHHPEGCPLWAERTVHRWKVQWNYDIILTERLRGILALTSAVWNRKGGVWVLTLVFFCHILFICLSVCLFARYLQKLWMDLRETLWEACSWGS